MHVMLRPLNVLGLLNDLCWHVPVDNKNKQVYHNCTNTTSTVNTAGAHEIFGICATLHDY